MFYSTFLWRLNLACPPPPVLFPPPSPLHIINDWSLILFNCLRVDASADTGTLVKVADFGLARILEKDYYRIKDMSRGLPQRWMALETLEGWKFSVKSDVVSCFGC